MNQNKNQKNNNSSGFFIYGKHPVLLALQNKKREFFKLYTSNKTELDNFILNNNLKPLKSGIVEYKTNNEIDKIAKENINHQGYLALVSNRNKTNFNDFLNIAKNNLPPVLVLDQITDPHNVGAIIRTAVAFGVKYIITTAYNSAKDSSVIFKTSAGLCDLINLIEIVNLNNALEDLKKIGYFIVGLAGEAKYDLNSIKDSNNLCLVVGSEGNGIRPLVKKNCDSLYKINIDSSVESLNVSVATAIALYKLWGK